MCVTGFVPIIESVPVGLSFFRVRMHKAASIRAVNSWDRESVAIIGIFLIVAASVAPHFALRGPSAHAVVNCRTSQSKQPCLTSDTLAWDVPYQQATAIPFLPAAPHSSGWDTWIYTPRHDAPQLYNRPPPSI